MDPKTLYYLIATAMIVIGLVGTVLPALPGLPLVFGGMLVAAWTDGFANVPVWVLVLLGLLTLLSLAIDFWATALGAKRVGASRAAVAGAALGTALGFFFGLPGLILGPFVGALVGELVAHRDATRAVQVGIGAWLGFFVGTVAKLAIAFMMLGVFLAAWLIN
jgi:hypothetical protein